MATKARVSTKSKAGTKGKEPARKTKAAAGRPATQDERPTIEDLEASVADQPKMIRPKFMEFDTPSGEKAIIKKLNVGDRDTVVNIASEGMPDDEMDMEQFCRQAVRLSMVYPLLDTDEKVNCLDSEDFQVIWENVNELSYRKVGEVVKRFLSRK